MEKWTAKIVADRLEEAVSTLRRLPPVKVQGYFNLWPMMKYTEMEILQMEKQPMRLRALPPAIDRLEETFEWMPWLEACGPRSLENFMLGVGLRPQHSVAQVGDRAYQDQHASQQPKELTERCCNTSA